MEFKAVSHGIYGLHALVDIGTEWNLKERQVEQIRERKG